MCSTKNTRHPTTRAHRPRPLPTPTTLITTTTPKQRHRHPTLRYGWGSMLFVFYWQRAVWCVDTRPPIATRFSHSTRSAREQRRCAFGKCVGLPRWCVHMYVCMCVCVCIAGTKCGIRAKHGRVCCIWRTRWCLHVQVLREALSFHARKIVQVCHRQSSRIEKHVCFIHFHSFVYYYRYCHYCIFLYVFDFFWSIFKFLSRS